MGNTTTHRPTRYTSPLGNGTFVRIKSVLSAAQKAQYSTNDEAHGITWVEAMDATLGSFGIVLGADKHGVNSYIRFIMSDAEAKNTWFYRDGWLTTVPEADVPAALVGPLKQAYEQRKRDDEDAGEDDDDDDDVVRTTTSSPLHAQMMTLAGLASISTDVEMLKVRMESMDRKLDTIIASLGDNEPPRSGRRRLRE